MLRSFFALYDRKNCFIGKNDKSIEKNDKDILILLFYNIKSKKSTVFERKDDILC